MGKGHEASVDECDLGHGVQQRCNLRAGDGKHAQQLWLTEAVAREQNVAHEARHEALWQRVRLCCAASRRPRLGVCQVVVCGLEPLENGLKETRHLARSQQLLDLAGQVVVSADDAQLVEDKLDVQGRVDVARLDELAAGVGWGGGLVLSRAK